MAWKYEYSFRNDFTPLCMRMLSYQARGIYRHCLEMGQAKVLTLWDEVGRTDGRAKWELCFVVTKVKLSIYLLAYLSHFYSERLICPPQWDQILSKVVLKFLCKLINISEVTKKSSGKVHITILLAISWKGEYQQAQINQT